MIVKVYDTEHLMYHSVQLFLIQLRMSATKKDYHFGTHIE
jgi:hypothetical protein